MMLGSMIVVTMLGHFMVSYLGLCSATLSVEECFEDCPWRRFLRFYWEDLFLRNMLRFSWGIFWGQFNRVCRGCVLRLWALRNVLKTVLEDDSWGFIERTCSWGICWGFLEEYFGGNLIGFVEAVFYDFERWGMFWRLSLKTILEVLLRVLV